VKNAAEKERNAMYHPTGRALTVLELLQSRPSISGPELAERLEMDVRTVRRYITILQDIGIPIEGTIGRHGGYRLRPGFKLPPLMFTEEEATAIALGLLGTSWLEIGLPSAATAGALAKVARVLPERGRERLNAISEHLILSPHIRESRPSATLLIDLGEAIQQRRRMRIAYQSSAERSTQRTVEPYAIVGWWGRWYLVAFCCLRQDYRLFRLDRMQNVQYLAETFARDEAFDSQAYAVAQLGTSTAGWQIEVVFQATLAVAQQKIPASYGSLTRTPAGIVFRCQTDDLLYMARYLMALNLPFVIGQPPELRDALRQLAAQLTQIASAQSV
jgi:predicted DNA-binding transcriptional regulator YafY